MMHHRGLGCVWQAAGEKDLPLETMRSGTWKPIPVSSGVSQWPRDGL